MSRFGVSDGAPFHRKVVKAGNEAFGAWCRAGAWSGAPENLTDGFIPPEIAAMIAPPGVWARLRAVGLTDAPADGQEGEQIHGYLEHNPSAEKVRATRAAWVARQRRHRDTPDESPPPSRSESRRDTQRDSREMSRGESRVSCSIDPDPDPDPPPPISPPSRGDGGDKPKRSGRSGMRKALDRIQSAYDAGIRAAIGGKSFASKVLTVPPDRDPLFVIAREHARGPGGERLVLDALDAWMRATAERFRRAIPHERARFYSNFNPQGCLDWLNNNCPDEHTPTERAPPPAPPTEDSTPPLNMSPAQRRELAQRAKENLNLRLRSTA